MKLTLVGDTNLFGYENPVQAFDRIAAELKGHDLLLGHAEGMFTRDTRHLPYKLFWRHCPPQAARGFVEAGFDGVSFASNVCSDRQAVVDTIDAATAAGLKFCGIGRNLEEARRPLILDHPAGPVALLSRTSVFWPPLVPANPDHPGAATVKAHTAYVPGRRAAEMPGSAPEIHTWPDADELSALLEDIRGVRARVKYLVLSMHWGISGSQEVQQYQKAIGHAAIEAGADVVFGHHPHVVQEIEVYRGKPIFYSLGNCAFGVSKKPGRPLEGILAKLELGTPQIQVAVRPLQRHADDGVTTLQAGEPGWQETVAYLTQQAHPDLRRRMQVTGNELCFACG